MLSGHDINQIISSDEDYYDSVSICELLFQLSIPQLVTYLEEKGYSKDKWRKHFPVEALLKLLVAKAFKKTSYRKVISSLSERDCMLLSFPYDPETGLYMRPSKSTLHNFAKKRIALEGLNKLMVMIGKKIVDINPGRMGLLIQLLLKRQDTVNILNITPIMRLKWIRLIFFIMETVFCSWFIQKVRTMMKNTICR